MIFDRSMWRMKRNMHFKGEFPLPNFHPGNLPVMLGVEWHRQDNCYSLAIFMAAKPVSYAVMCVIFLADPTMPICKSHFEFTWFFIAESILTKSTDVYQLISSCLWICQHTHIFMFTNIKHDVCASKHIKYQTISNHVCPICHEKSPHLWNHEALARSHPQIGPGTGYTSNLVIDTDS